MDNPALVRAGKPSRVRRHDARRKDVRKMGPLGTGDGRSPDEGEGAWRALASALRACAFVLEGQDPGNLSELSRAHLERLYWHITAVLTIDDQLRKEAQGSPPDASA